LFSNFFYLFFFFRNQGEAQYYNIVIDDEETADNGAWYYPNPKEKVTNRIVRITFSLFLSFLIQKAKFITNYVAFVKSVVSVSDAED